MMFARTPRREHDLSAQQALVCTMVLVSAAGGGVTDREIGTMAAQVQTLPVFHDFTAEQLKEATETAAALLAEEDGLNEASRLIRAALRPRLRETAYALACEVVSADGRAGEQTLQMLAFVRDELELDTLVACAIERGVRVRHRTA